MRHKEKRRADLVVADVLSGQVSHTLSSQTMLSMLDIMCMRVGAFILIIWNPVNYV